VADVGRFAAGRDHLSIGRGPWHPSATLRILVSVEGEDARRLERIAEARGKTPHDVVAELLRDADRPAA
jgi:hypothetical protein